MRTLQPNADFDYRRLEYVEDDDFQQYVTGDSLTLVASDSGTAAVQDAAGGVILISPSDGTVADNDETYLKGTKETFLFAADKPLEFRSRLKFTEANTDDANVIVGIKDAVAANTLQDNGAGPPASYSGAVFFKVDGGTVWWFETSIGTSQVTTQIADVANAGDGTYREFAILFRPITATTGEIVPLIDGVQCRDTNGVPIKHAITFTNATEMQRCVGAKNGDTNHEQLYVDYIRCRQLR